MKLFNIQNTFKLTALAMLLLGGLSVQAAEPQPGARAAATITPDANWSPDLPYERNDTTCGTPETGTQGIVMIGRGSGGVPQRQNFRCASIWQFEPLTRVVNSTWIHSNDGNLDCPTNQVIIGRKYDGPDHQYWQCANVVDAWGKYLQVIPFVNSGWMLERSHIYTCPENTVLIGRDFSRPNNSTINYKCGTLW